MSVSELKQNADQKMQKSIESLKNDLSKVRTGRAHPSLLDQVHVDYYGSPTPLSQVANLTLIDARTIGDQPWQKNMIAPLEKATRQPDLDMNPAYINEMISVPMPALTEERRKELVKVVKHEGENAKIAVRNIRRDANEHLKKMLKDKDISEDDERRAQDDVQKMTDKFVAEVDKLVTQKEADIMTV